MSPGGWQRHDPSDDNVGGVVPDTLRATATPIYVVDTRNPQIGRRVHETIPSSKVASNTTVKLVFSEVVQQQ